MTDFYPRFESAFLVDAVEASSISTADKSVMNRFAKNNAVLLAAKKSRMARKFANVLAQSFALDIPQLNTALHRNGTWDWLASEGKKLQIAGMIRGEEEDKTRETIRNEVDKSIGYYSDTITAMISEAATSSGFGSSIDDLVKIQRILLLENAGRATSLMFKSVETKKMADKALVHDSEKAASFSETDAEYVLFLLREVNSPVAEFIIDRVNSISVAPIKELVIKAIKDQLFIDYLRNITGDESAARILSRVENLLVKESAKLMDTINGYARIWATTDAAIFQNDGLMMFGGQAGLNGKFWYSMRDGFVRTFITSNGDHVANDGAGIIDIEKFFPDGSFDGGSGSVSPWNCRCNVSPCFQIS